MKTAGVKSLVLDALGTLPGPYTEHVIDETFHRIETTPQYLSRYTALCGELGKHVVNTRGGQWIANEIGKCGKVQVPTRHSTIIDSYSILDKVAVPVLRKPTEEEARKLMSDYYYANKDWLPAVIRHHRDEIVRLITAGVSVEEAFSSLAQHEPRPER